MYGRHPHHRDLRIALRFVPKLNVGVLFGGYAGNEVRLNDLYFFDIDSLHWEKKRVSEGSSVPCARNTHTASLVGDTKLVVFGGRDRHQFYNDVWILDLITLVWTQLVIPESLSRPLGRSGHVAEVIDDSIFIFGGWSGGVQRHEDVWELNIEKERFYLHDIWGECPSQRSGHTSCLISINEMLIFGGWGQNQYKNDVYVLKVTNTQTDEEGGEDDDLSSSNSNSNMLVEEKRLVWRKSVIKGKPPEPRRFHGMTCVGRNVFIYGGSRIEKPEFGDFKRMWLGPLSLVDLCIEVVTTTDFLETRRDEMKSKLPASLSHLIEEQVKFLQELERLDNLLLPEEQEIPY